LYLEAFYNCQGITGVKLPSTLKEIPENCFKGCTSLKTVIFNDGLVAIGEEAFASCHLADLYLPESLVSIESGAFLTGSVNNFYVPTSLKYIGGDAFRWCGGVNAVYITDLEAWLQIEFATATANPVYYSHKLFLNGQPIHNLVIPETITKINKYAFADCHNITGTLTFHNNITTDDIGERAFQSCKGITNIVFGSNMTYISDGMFEGFDGLTVLEIPEQITSIGAEAFSSCTNLQKIVFNGNVTIGSYAFERDSALKTLVFKAPLNKYYCGSCYFCNRGNYGSCEVNSRFDGFRDQTRQFVPEQIFVHSDSLYNYKNKYYNFDDIIVPLN
jgi:hypothetical protein